MSIRRKITLLFLGSLFLMVVIAFWVQYNAGQKNRSLQIASYLNDAKILLTPLARGDERQIRNTLSELGLRPTDQIPDGSRKRLLHKPLGYGEIEVVQHGGRSYLKLSYLDDTLWVYDPRQDAQRREQTISHLLFGLDIALLILIYLMVLKMLSPLKKIGNTMRHFSGGDLDARTEPMGDDEIGDVARNFNLMAEKLQKTLLSKETLLREVGHELRTPIAKGKFALEVLPESEKRTLLSDALNDLERLTQAILQEKLLDEEELNVTRFKASTLILNTLSKLTIPEEDIAVTVEDFTIDGDRYYLEMALKNLVDNALKYTRRLPVTLTATPHTITIISYGEPLEHALAYYLQPFTRGTRDESGFGLGLGIVAKIVHRHGYRLTYRHAEGANRFTLAFA